MAKKTNIEVLEDVHRQRYINSHSADISLFVSFMFLMFLFFTLIILYYFMDISFIPKDRHSFA